MKPNPKIRVRLTVPRWSYDGQTGILVLAGTLGTVGPMRLSEVTHGRDPSLSRRPDLTVYWDAVLVQDKANDDPDTVIEWEDTEVPPSEVVYVSFDQPAEPEAGQ